MKQLFTLIGRLLTGHYETVSFKTDDDDLLVIVSGNHTSLQNLKKNIYKKVYKRFSTPHEGLTSKQN